MSKLQTLIALTIILLGILLVGWLARYKLVVIDKQSCVEAHSTQTKNFVISCDFTE